MAVEFDQETGPVKTWKLTVCRWCDRYPRKCTPDRTCDLCLRKLVLGVLALRWR